MNKATTDREMPITQEDEPEEVEQDPSEAEDGEQDGEGFDAPPPSAGRPGQPGAQSTARFEGLKLRLRNGSAGRYILGIDVELSFEEVEPGDEQASDSDEEVEDEGEGEQDGDSDEEAEAEDEDEDAQASDSDEEAEDEDEDAQASDADEEAEDEGEGVQKFAASSAEAWPRMAKKAPAPSKATAKPKVKLANVQLGKKNNSVLIVQKALAKAVGLDYSSGPGHFGPATKAAYAKWQRKCGYSGSAADGVPGAASLKKLGSKYGFQVDTSTPPPSQGGVKSPVPGYKINYPYGVRNPRYGTGYHTGDDYASPVGTPVVAVRKGTIKWSDGNGGAYGNWIGLEADNGRVYVYCHLSARHVKKGQKVKAGQRLGLVGRTGKVTGPHLHFEDHPRGRFVYGHDRKPRW
jgi:murein DD-endopeptidase MepM/ murein hydrolase activator NlpD